jgi:hypothetical protein
MLIFIAVLLSFIVGLAQGIRIIRYLQIETKFTSNNNSDVSETSQDKMLQFMAGFTLATFFATTIYHLFELLPPKLPYTLIPYVLILLVNILINQIYPITNSSHDYVRMGYKN